MKTLWKVGIPAFLILLVVGLFFFFQYGGGGGWLEAGSPVVLISTSSPTESIDNVSYHYGTPTYERGFNLNQYQHKDACGTVHLPPVSWIAAFGNRTLEADFDVITTWGKPSGSECSTLNFIQELQSMRLELTEMRLDGETIGAEGELQTESKRYWKNELGIAVPKYFSSYSRDTYSVCKNLEDSGEIEASEREACETREEPPVLTERILAGDFIIDLKLTYTGGAYYWEDGYFVPTFYIPESYIEEPGEIVEETTETSEQEEFTEPEIEETEPDDYIELVQPSPQVVGGAGGGMDWNLIILIVIAVIAAVFTTFMLTRRKKSK